LEDFRNEVPTLMRLVLHKSTIFTLTKVNIVCTKIQLLKFHESVNLKCTFKNLLLLLTYETCDLVLLSIESLRTSLGGAYDSMKFGNSDINVKNNLKEVYKFTKY